MKKNLAKRDKILLAFFAVVVIGLAYYFLVYQPTTNRIETLQSNQQQIQTEMDTLTVKAGMMAKMQNELPKLKEVNKPVANYDNLKPVMASLNNIMTTSQQFDISFKTDTEEGSTGVVRRQVLINFYCNNYQDARKIVEYLHDVGYRCQISAVNLSSRQGTSAQAQSNINVDPIQATVSITFFETL